VALSVSAKVISFFRYRCVKEQAPLGEEKEALRGGWDGGVGKGACFVFEGAVLVQYGGQGTIGMHSRCLLPVKMCQALMKKKRN